MWQFLGSLIVLLGVIRPATCSDWHLLPKPEENHLCAMIPETGRFWLDTWAHLRGPRPKEYTYLMPIVIITVAITGVIAAQHCVRLTSTRTPECSVRARYRLLLISVIAPAPLVCCVFKLMMILMPQSWKLVICLTNCYEVAAFNCFFWLILSFLGDSFNGAVDTLKHSQGNLAMRMWAAPPLGCLFYPCLAPRPPCRGDLLTINVLLLQATVFLPTICLVEMNNILPSGLELLPQYLEMGSLVLAMYGLFALLFASHDILDRRCHAKFWVIKGACIVNKVTFRFFRGSVQDDVRIGELCYTSTVLSVARAAAVTAVLLMPFSVLSMYAYGRDDIKDDELSKQDKRGIQFSSEC